MSPSIAGQDLPGPDASLPDISARRSTIGRRAPIWGLRLALILLLVGAAAAEDPEEAELKELQRLLDRQTELATKTGMNADYVPGMASILSGTDLLDRGARTVWEALSLVPGVSQGLDVTGERQVLTRGVGFGYASGNVKILVDGMPMNATLTATANPVLNLPIEQVERIEVIRGPGSSVHGEYAYAGVVNVITRRRERGFHIQGGEGPDLGAGGVWHWEDPGRGRSVSINLVGLRAEGGARVEQDALHAIGRADLSHAPGETNETQRYGALFADLRWGKVFASLGLLDDAYGDHFGINHFLPPPSRRPVSRERLLSAQLGGDWDLSETLFARLRLEGLRYWRERQDLYAYPPSLLRAPALTLNLDPGPLDPSDQPITMDLDYRESSLLAGADLHWQPVPAHQFLLGLESRQVELDRASWGWPNFPLAMPPDWLDTGARRRVLSALVQDTYRVGEPLTLTATLRHDDYDDLGSYTSPRAAAVWRIDPNNILKLQYAKAFRPPTFYELAYQGEDAIDVAEIATYELGYILKRPNWEVRTILFHSDLAGPILLDGPGFINGPDAELQGVEVEYVQRLGGGIRVDANLSYVDSTQKATGAALPGGASLLGNLALRWQANPGLSAVLQLRYVGERNPGDARPPLDRYKLLDLTLNWKGPGPGPELHLGIKNLTDSGVRYPDQLTDFAGIPLPYPGSYPRPGRQLWLSVGYAF